MTIVYEKIKKKVKIRVWISWSMWSTVAFTTNFVVLEILMISSRFSERMMY